MQWFDAVPFWVLFTAIIASGLVTLKAGYRFGRFWTQRSQAPKKDSVDSLVAAILALLAFLLVFMTATGWRLARWPCSPCLPWASTMG